MVRGPLYAVPTEECPRRSKQQHVVHSFFRSFFPHACMQIMAKKMKRWEGGEHSPSRASSWCSRCPYRWQSRPWRRRRRHPTRSTSNKWRTLLLSCCLPPSLLVPGRVRDSALDCVRHSARPIPPAEDFGRRRRACERRSTDRSVCLSVHPYFPPLPPPSSQHTPLLPPLSTPLYLFFLGIA